ncbi:hypothetical protein PAXINDRAFT_20681 [Paxillus involutus ATCC 200175]|uniref:Uncharacterized protein n=1 Tax=Paxillus involutus ATCC 200175 TaxID=664439 RepID=A0A0C9SMG1_PAXIN|nr:hypothetical protein PAXINDRAFT_20681 [Paxillus involutus ATCC 200175]
MQRDERWVGILTTLVRTLTQYDLDGLPLSTTRQWSRPLRDGQREPARTAKWHDT